MVVALFKSERGSVTEAQSSAVTLVQADIGVSSGNIRANTMHLDGGIMRIFGTILLLMAVLPAISYAESAYVTDRLVVSIREGQGNEYPAIKSVASGTKLEVLQRLGGFALVRDTDNKEGWIAERYLIDTPPAHIRLESVRKDLKKSNIDLANLTQQLKKVKESAKRDTQRLLELESQVKPTGGSKAVVAGDNTENRISAGLWGNFRFDLIWLAISFAMLITGFLAGVIWLRELNRKKMGGMYLRI